MDKTLEIVMVAVALVVSIVIVTGILQGQSGKFGDFSESQTSSSSCSIDRTQLKTQVDCSECDSNGNNCNGWDDHEEEIIGNSECLDTSSIDKHEFC